MVMGKARRHLQIVIGAADSFCRGWGCFVFWVMRVGHALGHVTEAARFGNFTAAFRR